MTALRKFLFETELEDARDPAPAPLDAEEPPPGPTFGTAELEAARAEAFAAGAAHGAAEHAAAQQAALAAALAGIERALGESMARLDQAGERMVEDGARAAAAIVGKVAPVLAREHGAEELHRLFAETLRTIAEEPRVVVRLADALIDDLAPRLEDAARRSGYPGRVIVLADATVADGDGRIEWADGGVARDSSRLLAEAEALVARILEPAPPAPRPADGQPPLPQTETTHAAGQ
jgi:flagellar assembly protein FliH